MPRSSDLPNLLCYEQLLQRASALGAFEWPLLDENAACGLCYTSGTTGNPKGVVYHHRGAYLTAMNMALTWDMPKYPIFMTVVPMFHCNCWHQPIFIVLARKPDSIN